MNKFEPGDPAVNQSNQRVTVLQVEGNMVRVALSPIYSGPNMRVPEKYWVEQEALTKP